MKRCLFLFLTMLSLIGCQLDELRDDFRPSSHKAFSIEEAKEFFEKDYTEQLTRAEAAGTNERKFRSKLHSGDFTPLWDKAVYSESDGVAAYDVDILADRSIIAIRSKFGPNGAKAERLKVHQKLVVRRDVKTGAMASYVLSLIPDVGCDDRRVANKFRSRGEKKGFSGIAVYTTPDRGALVRVQEYKNGALKRGVYLPSGKESYLDRCRRAVEILNGTVLMARRNVMTRSGEDVWDDSWDDNDYSNWNLNDFEDLGSGIFTDGEGNYYIDIDYDGDFDLVTIAPGNVEDEKPEDPNIPNPEPDEEEDDEDENDGDDEYNDYPIIMPRPLTELIGRPEFYDERHKDFLDRYPSRTAPEYYKNYGHYYCKRFQNKTRTELSEEGKEWVDKTLVALQLKLNAIIMKDPLLEFNGEELKKAAYESHVSAYIESGVLELPLSDKVEILLTVDWKDLSSPEGRQQVGDIIEAQIGHYITHPGDALSDASYLMNNFSDILSRIRTYYHDNTQSAQPETKGITPALSEEYIYELILGPLIEYYEENIPGFSLPAN